METKSKIGITGKIRARFYDQESLNFWQKRWNKFALFSGRKDLYILGNLKREESFNNIICDAGINAHLRRLAHDTTFTGRITHMALGTGVVPVGRPNGTETTLYTEHHRNPTASFTTSGNRAFITAFFTEAEVAGTFTNFGNFIDGTATANTGRLWTLVRVSWTKTLTEALVIDCEYSFNNA